MAIRFIFLFSLMFLHILIVRAQTDIGAAARLISEADSVILISHVAIEEHHNKPEGIVVPPGMVDNRKPIVFPSFFSGTAINPDIIVQTKFLVKKDILRLSKIIMKPVRKLPVGYFPLCFEPHHAILIYHKRKFSYIDICFDCNDLVTSADLQLDNMDFEDGKWEQMKKFFLTQGLTYEMQEQH